MAQSSLEEFNEGNPPSSAMRLPIGRHGQASWTALAAYERAYTVPELKAIAHYFMGRNVTKTADSRTGSAKLLPSLEGIVLRGRALWFAVLDDSRFYAAAMTDADLRNASLADADISGARLSGAQLASASLPNSHLEMADLTGAHLEHAKLPYAILQGTALTIWDMPSRRECCHNGGFSMPVFVRVSIWSIFLVQILMLSTLLPQLHVRFGDTGVVGLAISTIVMVVSCLTLIAFSPALQEWSGRCRKIVVDDTGLWLWKYGEMMRWPDIQLLEGHKGGLAAIWEHMRFNIPGGAYSITSGEGIFSICSGVRDREGNRWSDDALRNLTRAHWTRSRNTSEGAIAHRAAG